MLSWATAGRIRYGDSAAVIAAMHAVTADLLAVITAKPAVIADLLVRHHRQAGGHRWPARRSSRPSRRSPPTCSSVTAGMQAVTAALLAVITAKPAVIAALLVSHRRQAGSQC